MTTAASSARVLECWPPTRSDLWGMAVSCHMNPAPMAGSFVLDRFSRNDPIHQWLPPDNLSQSTHHLGARPNIVAGMARR